MASKWSLTILASLAKQAEGGDKEAKRNLKSVSEHDFSVAIREFAENHGWRVWYQKVTGHMTQDGRWRAMAPSGEPDLRMARRWIDHSQILFVELKTEIGKLSDSQIDALDVLGEFGRVWRPRDAHLVLQELE